MQLFKILQNYNNTHAVFLKFLNSTIMIKVHLIAKIADSPPATVE